jgi:hypothetical protein
MTYSREYSQQLWNESGYVLLNPNILNESELLQKFPPNPFAESATQQYPLGSKLIRGVEEWIYCKNSSAALTVLGTPIQAPAAVHADQEDDLVVGVAAAIGDYEVSVTSTANVDTGALAELDGLKDGYLIVNDADGQGQARKIRGNAIFVTTGQAIVKLYDPLTVALTTSTEVGILHNPFKDVIAVAAVTTGLFIGVNELAITASYYFWAKSKGPGPGVMHAAVAKGTWVVVGTTAAKFDPAAAVTTEIIVGEMLTPGIADTEHALIYFYGR